MISRRDVLKGAAGMGVWIAGGVPAMARQQGLQQRRDALGRDEGIAKGADVAFGLDDFRPQALQLGQIANENAGRFFRSRRCFNNGFKALAQVTCV